MATLKISIPDELYDEIRSSARSDTLDEFVVEALRDRLAAKDLEAILDEVASEVGPTPPELVEEADAAWRAS